MNTQTMKTYPLALKMSLLTALLAWVVGCATGAKPEAMIPANYQLTHRHPYSTSVEVTGGQATNPAWTSEISNDAFATAITEAIAQSGVFSTVLNQGGSDYRLKVTLINLDQPMMGFNMTVNAVVGWSLIDVASGQPVFDEFIATPYKATVGDAFAGVKRLRLANEGAARENIKEGIRRLSELDLTATSNSKE